MESNKASVVAFHIVCLVVAFAMVVYGMMKFYLDESTSIVDAKVFHDSSDDIYPVFTLCLEMDFKDADYTDPNHPLPLYAYKKEKDEKFNMKLNEINDYVNFMMGKKMSEQILNYDYDNITVDINDYLAMVRVRSGNDILYIWEAKDKDKPKPMFISYRHPILKCFTLDFTELSGIISGESDTKISDIEIRFNKDEPASELFTDKSTMIWALYMHYPKQLMRSTALERDHLGITSTTFNTIVSIDSVEVIRRRNTRFTICDENYRQEDDMILTRLAEKEGCIAPYWNLNDKGVKKQCTNISEMSNVLTPDLLSISPKFMSQFENEAPCSQVYGMTYTTKNLYPPPSPPEIPSCGDSQTPPDKPPQDGSDPPGDTNAMSNAEGGNNPPNNPNNGQQANTQTDLQNQGNNPDGSPPIQGPPLGSPPRQGESNLVRVKRGGPKGPPPFRGIVINFKSMQYKEIKHIQSFNGESLLGNAGGYVGLFIGCTIWEAPDFIEFLYRKFRGWIKSVSGFQNKHYFLDIMKPQTVD